MKIITRAVIDIATMTVEEEDSYEYEGPVCECKDAGSPPQPVDPYQQAAAQYGLSTGTALFNAGLNRTNAVTPLGSSTWSASYPGGTYNASAPTPPYSGLTGGSASGPGARFGGGPSFGLPPGRSGFNDPSGRDAAGGAPTYTNTTQLAPQFQSVLDKPIDTSGVIGAPGGPSMMGARNQIQDALYRQQSQYLDPQFQLSDEQLTSKLANQGIMPGSEAYKNAMDQQNRDKTFAYGNAANQAITGATGQEQALQGIGTAGLQAGIAARDTPLNEFNSLLGRSGASATAQTPDISGAFGQQYQGALAGYNANVASNNATTADVSSLLIAAMMAY